MLKKHLAIVIAGRTQQACVQTWWYLAVTNKNPENTRFAAVRIKKKL